MSQAVDHLLALGGLTVRDVELRWETHALHVSEDGVPAYKLGTMQAPDGEHPWQLIGLRVDAGPASGLVSSLSLGTAEGRSDLFQGSLPVGVLVPHFAQCPRQSAQWDGALWGSVGSAELADVTPAAVAAELGGSVDGSFVGAPYTGKTLGPFSPTDFVSFDYIGDSASPLRTLGVQFTPDYQGSGPHQLVGRGASNVAGIYLSLNASGNSLWALNGPGGITITGNQIVGLSITDQVQHWIFLRYCFDASEDCSLYHFLAGSDAAAANDSTAVAQTHDRTESSTQLGEHYTGNPWLGSVEQLALWDRYLTVDEMGDVSASGSPSLEGGNPYASTTGLVLDRAKGGCVSMLFARKRPR